LSSEAAATGQRRGATELHPEGLHETSPDVSVNRLGREESDEEVEGKKESERKQLQDCSLPTYHVLVSFPEINFFTLTYLLQIESLPPRKNTNQIFMSIEPHLDLNSYFVYFVHLKSQWSTSLILESERAKTKKNSNCTFKERKHRFIQK